VATQLDRSPLWTQPAVGLGALVLLVAGALAWALLPRNSRPCRCLLRAEQPGGSLLVLPVTIEEPTAESDWLREAWPR
jgi:hypothetical protein